MGKYTELFRINEQNLGLRKQFIRLTPEQVAVLRQLQPWAEEHASQIAKAFYDHQFSFSETLEFFRNYAQQKGITLDQLRARLEKTQADYFRQIFREASTGGNFGTDYFETRLRIGVMHDVIDLPQKWYLGSYALYLDLVREYLRNTFPENDSFARDAYEAIARVFYYDLQAVCDSYILSMVRSFGYNTDTLTLQSSRQDLSDCFGQIKSSVRSALGATLEASQTLWHASSQLTSATDQTRQATGDIATTIEQVARLSTHQLEQVHRANRSVGQIKQLALQISDGAHQQAQAVANAQAVSQNLNSLMNETAGKVTEMGGRFQQISNIVEIIKSIASQTNMLALNAAIEAARAGEHGRGFAVVAEEVRNLAERSANSAKEIGTLIGSMQQSVSEVVRAMQNAVQEVQQGIAQAIESIATVVHQYQATAQQMTQQAEEVAQVMDKTVQISEEHSASAQEISAATQQVAAQMEQIASLANDLQQIANTMQSALASFDVKSLTQEGSSLRAA